MSDTPASRDLDADQLPRALAEAFEPAPPANDLWSLRRERDWEFDLCYVESPGGLWQANIGFDGGDDLDPVRWEPIPDLTQSHAATVESELARRGLQQAYLEALSGIVAPDVDLTRPDWFAEGLWAMVTAGTEARCRAALLAVGGDK